ncbi:50S ribosomal protein L17 [Fulvivirga sedimenti]|uniref:Large ribosomal subunit protein bL17 n=1 Tax=Fulvivirga sedimenti TaxID=2879465 RepID=A0A9X1HNC7_9BACT|nr:50S ribosomal protein L17 [Fulvivirga sedimenti]MCA6074185.1 50S ribosomal protein L17 [Fulvivirga sedimenti]
MRHGKKFNHLSRTAPHRKAMLSNMASSLILNKRITTTVAKAKELRKYVEPLLTKAKEDTTHSRRVVFSYLNDKGSVQTLFDEVATKIADRPGGYTRIIKTGNRLGDNADMCIIELVDYNELMLADKPAKAKTRRSRRGKKSSSDDSGAVTAAKAEVKAAASDIAEKAEDVAEDAADVVADAAATAESAVEDAVEVVEEKAEAVAEAAEEVVEEAVEKVEEVIDEVTEETEEKKEEDSDEEEKK